MIGLVISVRVMQGSMLFDMRASDIEDSIFCGQLLSPVAEYNKATVSEALATSDTNSATSTSLIDLFGYIEINASPKQEIYNREESTVRPRSGTESSHRYRWYTDSHHARLAEW